MAEQIPAQLQNKIAQFQQIQQQIQVISSQKFQLEASLRDTERALTEVEKLSEDTPIYKSVGNLFVRAEDKEGVQKELTEKKETIDIRIKAMNRQEKQLMDKYQELQKELTEAISSQKGHDNS